jgi:acetate kinase
MRDERELARGGIERIGSDASRSFVESAGRRRESTRKVRDHADAVQRCLAELTDPEQGCLADASQVAGIGLKALHGGRLSGAWRVTPDVLAAMEDMRQVAAAHNPAYVAAMRLLSEKLPDIPLVAAFETGFHATVPDRWRFYGAPHAWAEHYYVRRWGFHGASHRYIGERMEQLVSRDAADTRALRVISCHLGGSSSLCAMRGAQSVATSMGMSPQSGIPHNNRCGDFDPFALPWIIQRSGKSLDELLAELAGQSGLMGLSGVSGDVRDLEVAAEAGNARARLALDVFITSVRQYLGSLLVELGGADVMVFTGGIGENGVNIRAAVCGGLDELGIVLDADANRAARGETRIDSPTSRAQIWVVPTNEEIVVARQVQEVLRAATA